MPVIELRQYTMQPGKRDVLVDLFDRVLVAGQEAAGMRWHGAYRDLDRPDRLVFIRSFPDMEARLRSLTAFYEESAVWKANRDAANATIVNSNDVLLLRPIAGPDDVREPPAALLVAEVDGLAAPAWYETEPAKNTYPRLPVREGERYVVAMVAPGAARLPPELTRALARPMERLRLAPTAPSGARDFDFLMGTWRVRNRRRRNPLTGSDSWYEFEGSVAARPLWPGANVNECDYEGPGGRLRGATLRLFEPATGLWRLYWASSATGTLESPVCGSFKDGRGEFYGHEIWNGKAIFCRFIWSDITPTSCHWEQAFSVDGGRKWETNWTTDFTRVTGR